MSSRLPDGKYLFIHATHARNSGSSLYCGSVGSFTKAAETMPLEASTPAGRMTIATEVAGLSTNCHGCQPSSCALRIACTANFGVEMLRKTLALVEARSMIWES